MLRAYKEDKVMRIVLGKDGKFTFDVTDTNAEVTLRNTADGIVVTIDGKRSKSFFTMALKAIKKRL